MTQEAPNELDFFAFSHSETLLLREQGVGSSNLPAPTNQINVLAIR
jgi:hypothetical protein